MWWVDYVSAYLYGLKAVALVLAVIILISSLDDLFIDLVYWSRRLWRRLTVYRRHARMAPSELEAQDEKPLAIMVPAWQEHGVIDRMAELAATTLDYENYHIFVGTYPNDPQTQSDVEKVCARFPNVHKVVGARDGPTSKADCLNNVLDAIFQFEERAGIEFAGFILHDSEDVLSPMELRVFNHLVGRKDLIQLPVYPLPRPWTDFTSCHYLDEFAETHGKDLLVREALVGQVPSAGVGTCFSRKAVMALLTHGKGTAFDIRSLTEDYDIGLRLKGMGMEEVFVRFPTDPRSTGSQRAPADRRLGQSARELSTVCVREYFPSVARAAIRQKSRWIIGIIYQGTKTMGWSRNWGLNYFLWRDRKGVITNFAGLLATLVLLQLVGLWLYQRLVPDSYRFLSIFEDSAWLALLLVANLALLCNRALQRVYFVTSYYGLAQGLLSVPRLAWGNVINFFANWRALKQTLQAQDVRGIAWAKTEHDFPTLGEERGMHEPLGQILVAQSALTQEQLHEALAQPEPGLRLGALLVHRGLITPEQLAAAVAEQFHVAWERFDSRGANPDLVAAVPAAVALQYAVLPIRVEDDTLVLACESYLDPVALAAIGRKLGRAVSYVIVPKGEVTVGLRRWYAADSDAEALRAGVVAPLAPPSATPQTSDLVWRVYAGGQLLLGDILCALGHIEPAALKSVLIQHAKTRARLGEFMVERGLLAQPVLDEALALQQRLQPPVRELFAGHARASNWQWAVGH
ncbi:MAG TPA: glycosyl transferase family protein [Ottowia sp.]|uniref:glycosyl transferase family protein n=1 Tax=Ottowia sp. TaxID=1898956 RepID=UPI002CB05F99|nr:glycosyl transferase family protein [Ottowia sp.]HMN22158.1 glycosyl transferase family protein [Ottowia sp.]